MDDAIELLRMPDSVTPIRLTVIRLNSDWFGRPNGQMGPALAANSTLDKLFVSNGFLDEAGAQELAAAVLKHKRLQSLSVITARPGARVLAETLLQKSVLTWLNFGGSAIGNDARFNSLLKDALEANGTLHTLHLCNTGIGDHTAQALADALAQNVSLRMLDLSNNCITDAGALALAEALKHGSRLAYLCLRCNRINDNGAGALFNALEFNECLTELDLFHNFAGNIACRAMAKMLLRNTRLKVLLLHVLQFDCCNTATELANALAQNKTLVALRAIVVDGSETIDSAALEILAKGLTHNCALQELQLSFGSCGEAMAQRLLRRLNQNVALRYLDLSHNCIGHKTIQLCAPVLARNRCLQTLDLSHNKMEGAAHQALARALMRNGCLTLCYIASNTSTNYNCALFDLCDRNKKHWHRKNAHARTAIAAYRVALALRRGTIEHGNDFLQKALQNVHTTGQMIAERV